MRALLLSLFVASMLQCGCAHRRLMQRTVEQAQTLADVQERQILDNIAMAIAKPNSTPFFAIPSSGSATVNQSQNASGGLNWNTFRFTGANLGASGQMGLSENWTLKPINEPERLEMMKCLYQHAVGDLGRDGCQDCKTKLANYFDDETKLCDLPSCFFEVHDCPPPGSGCFDGEDCCVKFGHHCGTYVWVRPQHYGDLSRITLAVLDLATISNTDLVKRIKRPEPVSRVQLTESFIAMIDGKPRLIQGNYALTTEQYQELQEKGATQPKTLLDLFQEKTLDTHGATDNQGGLRSSDLKIQSVTEPVGKDRREVGSGLESLLHSTNAAARFQ